ncbi:hypothetical protein Dimus_026045 [Dionaea muscipula]
MAEVSSSISFSKSKLSNGSGLSSKHIYDDVFSSPVKLKSSSFSSSSFAVDDYADIFARSRASLPSSIPVLDLPVAGEMDDDFVRVRSSGVDYSGIFGGSGGEDGLALNSDCFPPPNSKKAKSPAKKPRSKVAPLIQTRSLQLHEGVDRNQMPNGSSPQSSSISVNYESVQYHKSREGIKGVTHIDAVPGVLSSVFDGVAPSRKDVPVERVQLIVDDANISLDFGKGKKQKKLSRKEVTHEKQIQDDSWHEREEDSGSGLHPFENSNNTFEASAKAAEPSDTTMPILAAPQSADPDSSLDNRSIDSSFKIYDENLHTGGNTAVESSSPSSPTLSEELDVNSDAAICAAAVRRAIEEAEAQIRLAKEMLQVCDGHGPVKMTFKDSLKFRAINNNKHVSQADGFKENNNVHESSAHVEDTSVISSGLKGQSTNEIERVGFNLEDQIKVSKDVETGNSRANADDLKSAQESSSTDGEGGGEWETAKHLSQLLTGVKNRLVSFMAWQADGEKKVMQKQAAEASDSLDQSKDSDKVVKDMKVTEEKESNGNQDKVHWDGGRAQDATDMMASSAPEVCELVENDMTDNDVLAQETIYLGFKVWPDAENPKKLTDPPGFEEKAKVTEIQDSSCIHNFEWRQKEVVDCAEGDMADEVLEQNQEKLVDGFQMQEYEASATDTENSVLHTEIPEHAEYMVDHDVEEAIDESLNEVLRDAKQTMTNSDHSGYSTDMESIKRGEKDMKKVVLEHQVENSKLLNEAYLVRTTVEEGAAAKDEREENDDTEREIYCNVAEAQQNITETYSVDKIGAGEEGKGNTCKSEENKDINRHDDQTVAQQQLETRNIVIETCLGAETSGEEGTEDATVWSEYEEIGGETDPIVVQEPRDIIVLNKVDLVGEIGDGGSVEDLDGWENNQVNGKTEQKVGGEQQRITDMRIEASLLKESGKLGGAEDAYKLEENEEIGRCSDVTDQSEETNMLIDVTEDSVNDEHLTADDHNSEQEKREFLSTSEAHQQDKTSISDFSCEGNTRMAETSTFSQSEAYDEESIAVQMQKELIQEMVITTVLAKDMDSDEIRETNAACGHQSYEESGFEEIEIDKSEGPEPVDVKARESVDDSNLKNDSKNLVHEFGGTRNISGRHAVIDQEKEKRGVEAIHKRRRWFEGMGKVVSALQPSIFGGDSATTETAEEATATSTLEQSVEAQVEESVTKSGEATHVGESGIATDLESDTSKNQDKRRKNIEATHKRRRWFETREEASISERSRIFVEGSMEMDHGIRRGCIFGFNSEDADGSVNTTSECSDERKADANIYQGEFSNTEAAHRRKRWFENVEKLEPIKQPIVLDDCMMNSIINQEAECDGSSFQQSELGETSGVMEADTNDKEEPGSGPHQDADEVKRRKREKEKEKLAVERAIREARERAFAEARERAALDRTTGEVRQRVAGPPHDRPGKTSAEAKPVPDRASTEARLRAERAAVERATAEARERALQKAMSEKSVYKPREQLGKNTADKSSALDQPPGSSPYNSSRNPSSFDSAPLPAERTDITSDESVQRCKARQERHKRTMERAAKALEEKNLRDLQALKEQAERNRYAAVLDLEVRRWCGGKEGNLRALLSTLQYILAPDSGWQPMSLTDLVTSTAVRKAYRRATLCVHPDKLQQRSASVQQKYVCEKVFDLLKEAWQKFSPDER